MISVINKLFKKKKATLPEYVFAELQLVVPYIRYMANDDGEREPVVMLWLGRNSPPVTAGGKMVRKRLARLYPELEEYQLDRAEQFLSAKEVMARIEDRERELYRELYSSNQPHKKRKVAHCGRRKR